MTLTLTSQAFQQNGEIPARHTPKRTFANRFALLARTGSRDFVRGERESGGGQLAPI